ncbi:MAG: hypothetical protein Q7V43_24160 [Myxococcales bacterium]|nr:hypothetical protein [Myxococcales bacterium]
MPPRPCSVRRLAALVVLAAPALAAGQPRPMEYARPSPAPERAGHGELIAFARDVVAARHGDRVLLAWIDHTRSGNGQLRTSLLRLDADGALVRARPDAPVADSLRTPTLAWDGRRGVLAWVVPPPPPPPRAVPGGPPVPRRVPGATAPPIDETLGLRERSGGDIVVQRLDADGLPEGAARVVFHENSRLTRVAVALDQGAAVLAWTGAIVTDDEVRETVRALRLGPDLAPTTPMALHAGLIGELGDVLTLTPRPDRSFTLRASGAACRSLPHEPPPPLFTDDASARVESPSRSLMPQQPLRELAGPPIECEPPGLYETTLAPGAPIAPMRRVAALSDRPPPSLRAPDLTPRVRPPPGFDVPIVERPVAPPDPTAADPFAAPRARAADGTHLAVIDQGGRTLALRSGDRAAVLATSPLGFASVALLPGAPAIVLSREGVWSGPVRAWIADRPGTAPVALPHATVVPVAAPRVPVTQPYVYDEAYARLWVRARAARAVFMRHENTAGALAARPEAPTDPRMPGILSQRARLRARWESVCGGLMTRASQLARRGAGAAVTQGAQSLCDMHPDLVLGAPINQAL